MVIAYSDSPSLGALQWLRKQASSDRTTRRLAQRCQIVLLTIDGTQQISSSTNPAANMSNAGAAINDAASPSPNERLLN